MKILINDGIHPDGKLLLEEAGFDLSMEKVPQDELAKELPAYDAVVVRSATKVRKEVIDQCPKLKVIARGGVGLDNIDVDYARSKKIAVINTPTASSQSVAELALGHMLTLSRSLHLANRDMPKRGWEDFKALKKSYSGGAELKGKTMGIIGFGSIGQRITQLGLALGMKVLPVDLKIDQSTLQFNLYDQGRVGVFADVYTVPMDELLEDSDYITLHVPFSGGTAILGSEEMAKMKKGVCIINTSRGGAVDEEALLDGLNSGQIGGAGLDVFENEPKPKKQLLQHERVSVSPHIGASTAEAQRNIGLELADQLISLLSE
jgi:D-3-phosphoglycerate dehydrogenase